ncbi:MAG: CHASE2 domain-containing protein [Candidatus Binatia bacterium]
MKLLQTLRRRKRRFFKSLLLGVGVSILVSIASYLGYLDSIEVKALDLLLRLRGQQRSPEIVLIKIDDQAFAKLGEKQPLPRDYIASLVDVAARGGARVIGIDIEFKVATDPVADQKLLTAIAAAKANGVTKVVPVFVIRPAQEDEQGLTYRHLPFFDPGLKVVAGFANAPMDGDGLVRQVPLAVRGEKGTILPSFALAVLARHADYDSASLSQQLHEGNVRLNLPEWHKLNGKLLPNATPFEFHLDESWKINFAGGQGSFASLPSEPLAQLARANIPLATDNPFRGKIVLIGASFQESRDFFATPNGLMSGLEIHANIIHTLLTRSHIKPANRILAMLLLLLFAVAASVLTTLLRPATVIVLSLVAIPVVLLPLSYAALTQLGLWVDFATPLLVTSWGALATEYRDSRQVRKSLGEFVGWEVADQIVHQDEDLQGKSFEVSVFFTDVRDYTTLCESASPDQIAALMREVFGVMGKVIASHGGHIFDFIGDAVLAVFGAPKTNPNHADAAVQSAIEVTAALDELNGRWEKRGIPRLRIGVGIHSGPVVIGIVGTGERKKYDVTGDTVNTGSRVEGLNKETGTTILITRETMGQLKRQFAIRPCGTVKVKGRAQAVEVFEVKSVGAMEG